jgi:cytochrome c oxidase subunit 3
MDNINYKNEIKKKTSKPLLWIAMVSIVMFFAGLTSAVVVSQGGGSFLEVPMPKAFLWSTIIILASSLVFHFGLVSVKKGNFGAAKISVLVTLLLGIGFMMSQWSGWTYLYENGIIAVGASSTPSSSFLYLLTAMHIAHLIGGLISLLVVFVKLSRNKYSIENYLGVQVSITYWHFLGGLWLYLYLFFMYIIA